MAGLVPAIHVLLCDNGSETWITGTSPVMTKIFSAPIMDKAMTESLPLFRGIISGQLRRGDAEVADRVDRIASGLKQLGVAQGDSVCMLMRNDIAFIEAAYAAMRLGAYGVPVNWHFKPEEINYVLKDSGTSVLIAHADMLHQLREAIPPEVTALSVPTPPEILANYKINPEHLATPDFAIDFETWLKQHPRYDGPAVPQPANMIYTSGTTGHPKGVRRFAPTPDQTANAERMRAMIYGLKPGARVAAGPALSFRAELVRLARRSPRRRAGADAAL